MSVSTAEINLLVQVETLRPREASLLSVSRLEPRPRPPHLGWFHRTLSPRGTRIQGVQAPLWTGRWEAE